MLVIVDFGEYYMKLLNKDEFIANEIKFYFIKENVKEGEKLPSERELAEIMCVHRGTVRSAYKILEEEGIIEIRERSGRYMGHPRVKNNLQQIRSFGEKVNDIGMKMETKLLAFETLEVDKNLYKKIKLPIGTPIYKITRLCKVIREDTALPIGIEYSYIPEAVAPKLFHHNLEETPLYHILINEYQCIPQRADHKLGIVYADEFEAKTLVTDLLTALVRQRGIIYDKDNHVIQYINAIYKKDWVEYEQSDSIILGKMKEVLYGL
jgi:GntR family transcriptional regulator